MMYCPFCKEQVKPDAVKCPHCSSSLNGGTAEVVPGMTTLVLDQGLIYFGKFAISVLAIFFIVAATFYGVDLKGC